MRDLHVRASGADDIDYVLALEAAPENRPFILPWPRREHEAARFDPDVRHLILETDGHRCGFLLLAGVQSPHGSLELRRIVVASPGKGIGRAALDWVKRFAFVDHDHHRLWLDVKATNERAVRLYLAAGFRLEGTLRECIRGPDGYESLHVLSMLRPEFVG